VQPRQLARDLAVYALRTNTLAPATTTNVYAIGTTKLLIVDPAPEDPAQQSALLRWLEGLREQGRTLEAALLTHHHADHVGAADLLSRQLQMPLWAHEQTVERLPRVQFARKIVDNESIQLGDDRWLAIHTPGHAPGHLCLHNPRTHVLVLGDMIASGSSILIGPDDGDMSQYLLQLERLERLHARLGLPSHGEPIDTPSTALEQTRRHRLVREALILNALRSQSRASLEVLLDRAYNDTPIWLWPLARQSLKSHLIKLKKEGRAKMLSDNCYQAITR
jgi:glyoxylase-like metal-dependent hydrolase (beta-lactamase superfamily II)